MTPELLGHIIDDNGGYFTPEEFDPAGQGINGIQRNLVETVLLFRAWAGYPMLLTSVYRDGDDGAHGQGLAVDFLLFTDWLREPLDPWTLWTLASTWPFQGVGIYFDWSFTDKDGNDRRAVGIHGDLEESGDRPLRWIGFADKDRRYYYYQQKNGLFYAKDRPDPITLYTAIRQFEIK